MTTFDERERGFENKFIHDEELRFKVEVRRNWLLGNWAAQKLGLSADAAQKYADDFVAYEVEPTNDHDVIGKIVTELAIAGCRITVADVRTVALKFEEQAKNEVAVGKSTVI